MRFIIGGLLLLALASSAHAANTSLAIIFNSPTSTAANCTINYPSGQTFFTVPVAAGTLIATCTITPAGWSGSLALSGADAGSFGVTNSSTLVVGATAISAARTYNVTITATP